MVFGGIAVVILVILAYYSDRFTLPRRTGSPADVHEFPGGLIEGRSPVPLVLVLLIMGIVAWGIAYILITGISNLRI